MTHNLRQAAALFAQRRYAQALDAIDTTDLSVAADHLRALCQLHLGNAVLAISLLEALLKRAPQDAEIARNLAIACRQSGRLDQAAAAYERAFAVSADVAILIQLAEIDCDRNRLADAKSRLRDIPRGDPHYVSALATLASLHEQEGADREAMEVADNALAIHPGNFKAGYVRVAVFIKQRRYEDALAALDDLNPPTPVNESLCAARRADCLIALGRYSDGFGEVAQGNAILAASDAVRQLRQTSHYGPDFLASWSRYLTDERLEEWLATADKVADEPVFLVGFPRSGTTLMERMLGLAGDLEVIEERPTLAPLITELERAIAQGRCPGGRDLLRQRYNELVLQYATAASCVVDKMPLNSAFLALIYRVFPRARIIFAVRDPRAVCLSCFRQSFGLNEAMAQFLDWNQTAMYYSQVMKLAVDALQKLPIRHVFVRYESLVESPQATLEPVLDMLNLEWRDEMLGFHRRKGRINTPSYRQVTQPLYQSATSAWQHFSQVSAIEPALRPWLTHWGYD